MQRIPVNIIVSVWFSWFLLCCSSDNSVKSNPRSPDPLRTVQALLELHDLLGKQPEERSQAARQRPVDEAALIELVHEFEKDDPFLANLYVGFVVGALARYQTRLRVNVKGNCAEIRAGDLQVVLKLVGDVWRVDLEKSVPEEIKVRAKMEKLRLSRARVTG